MRPLERASIALAGAGFEQGKNEQFSATLLEFAIEHTSERYTLVKIIVKEIADRSLIACVTNFRRLR